jgi:hypothetical protein
MTESLLGVVVVCLLAVIGLQIALLLRKVGVDLSSWPRRPSRFRPFAD